MTIPAGLVVAGGGPFLILRPEVWWNLSTRWRVRDPRSRASDEFIFWTKVSGWAYIALSVWMATTPLYLDPRGG